MTRSHWGNGIADRLRSEGRLPAASGAATGAAAGKSGSTREQSRGRAAALPAATLPALLRVLGAPRTKKTSNRVIYIGPKCPACHRGKVPRVMPSKAFERYAAQAVPDFARVWSGYATIESMVHVRATFYRDALRGDLNGYTQALGDILQEARVIDNDGLIDSWDGSRRALDRKNPRVEVVITAIEATS